MNESTGVTTAVPDDPSCPLPGDVIVGVANLVRQCQDSTSLYFVVYNFPRGPWRTVSESSTIRKACTDPEGSCELTGIGRDWLQIDVRCYHCASIAYFENLTSGNVASDPTGGHFVASLSTPTLKHRVCNPLNIGPNGRVAFLGPFALVLNENDLTIDSGQGTYYLERCGTKLRKRITTYAGFIGKPTSQIGGNAHEIAWLDGRYLREIQLPSLRERRIQLPAPVGTASGIAVTRSHLYFVANRIWRSNAS